MANITLLGLGAMGSRMAMNLLKAGHVLTVWNRTPTASNALSSAGAIVALTPREAVLNADMVLSMVRDDKASRDTWLDNSTGALEGMRPDAIAVESSTLTHGWIRELSSEMATRQQAFVEAPVSGSRPQAAEGTLVWFAGGREEEIRKIKPILMQMGTVVYHTGTHGSAALTKLATNALMGVQVTAIAEIIGILNREGADVHRVLKAVSCTSAWSPLASGISGLMLSGNHIPQFPVDLIEKDLGYILECVDVPEQLAPTLKCTRDVFQRAISQGQGADNMSGVVRLYN
ncbi:TPA: NAD(P)-dependent oxidoreductase [Enterobacter hormaechei subsp. xiangfangensis]|nr:NAD(P)-dependent oxidoreductase [Enterobacter hormaechei subsp. xiangfangensis]